MKNSFSLVVLWIIVLESRLLQNISFLSMVMSDKSLNCTFWALWQNNSGGQSRSWLQNELLLIKLGDNYTMQSHWLLYTFHPDLSPMCPDYKHNLFLAAITFENCCSVWNGTGWGQDTSLNTILCVAWILYWVMFWFQISETCLGKAGVGNMYFALAQTQSNVCSEVLFRYYDDRWSRKHWKLHNRRYENLEPMWYWTLRLIWLNFFIFSNQKWNILQINTDISVISQYAIRHIADMSVWVNTSSWDFSNLQLDSVDFSHIHIFLGYTFICCFFLCCSFVNNIYIIQLFL